MFDTDWSPNITPAIVRTARQSRGGTSTHHRLTEYRTLGIDHNSRSGVLDTVLSRHNSGHTTEGDEIPFLPVSWQYDRRPIMIALSQGFLVLVDWILAFYP
jgi:hypothetical protein